MSRKISRRDLFTKVVPAGAALAVVPKAFSAGVALAFYHGVASGDPTQSEVIIWTRVTTSKRSVSVVWEFASDAEFVNRVASGEIETSIAQDYTVKVDVASLKPDTEYFYRFTAMDIQSTIGQTRTLPQGPLDSFTLGVCSCSNYPTGYFNAYKAMAEDTNLDVVLHLGDYIYEYDADGYASAKSMGLGRVSNPLNELTRLADYRHRHAQYKSDPDLQKLHARRPFILSWDDHEVADNPWTDGARNHNEGEGDWQKRKAAALQAYYEWMPIRVPKQAPLTQQWRSFEIGDLATLIMLETRFSARDKQVELGRDMLYLTIKFDISDPDSPQLVDSKSTGAHIEVLKQPFDVTQEKPKAILNYQRIKKFQAMEKLPKSIEYYPDITKFTTEVLDDADRQLLGKDQRKFVAKTLAQSSSKKPWQIIGNQTLFAKMDTPNLAESLTSEEKEKFPSFYKEFLYWSRFGVPFGTDSWNGYGAEREWLLGEAVKNNSNMIVLTGDTHSSWGIDLKMQTPQPTDEQWHAVELGVSAITSPSIAESLSIEPDRISEMLIDSNENLQYSQTANRGYLSVKLTHEKVDTQFHYISTIEDKVFQSAGIDRFEVVKRDSGKGVQLKKV